MKTLTTKLGKIISIRLPQPTDLNALYKYAKTIEAEDTYITLNPKEPITLEEEKSFLKHTIDQINKKTKLHFLVLDGDQIIGASHIEKNGRRSTHIGTFGIALLKEYRSQGIGKKLMEYIISEAQTTLKVSKITLNCLANNKVAIKLYKKLGFKKYGRLPQGHQFHQKFVDTIYFYKDLK
jgi:RimJ/RimL family protein N-acetyltransferase